MQELKSWVAEIKAKESGKSREFIDHQYFFRDPCRPHFIDNRFFFSPADGIILYQTQVTRASGKILEVKGEQFTLAELLGDEDLAVPSLVIGVFMTAHDVHINRMAMSGVLDYRKLPPLATRNLPMLATEKGLLQGVISSTMPDYVKQNERMFNTVRNSFWNYKFYIIQIADSDVDIILPFHLEQSASLYQNERFSFVRWGSQVDLVLPLDPRYKFTPLLKPMQHVEAGIDQLVQIEPRRTK